MSLFVRLYCSFFNHRKTRKLKAAIGNDALWVVPRLWAYAAEYHPDGTLPGYDARELASAIGYEGDPDKLMQALLDCPWLDSDPLRVHDWEEHNNYHQTFSERAKKAAAARWEKEKESTVQERKGKERSQALLNDATSIATSMLQASDAADEPPPTALSDSQWLELLAMDKTYAGIDVIREHGKMVQWCNANRKKPSRRRFINWLNRVEKPMTVQAIQPELTNRPANERNGTQSNGMNGAELIVRQKEFERVMARIKAIRDSYGEHQTMDAKDREELRRLGVRRKELKEILGIAC